MFLFMANPSLQQDATTLESMYTLLGNFNKVHDKISDEEKNQSCP
ncbi:hypothetical protein [Anaerotignum propionicum]|nr:hypothetical protein [Anaerotignum propionicum]